MSERPSPTPEGQLIATALANLRPKISVREAARRAGISETWWHHIAKGFQMIKGEAIPVTDASAETVARMAKVVGVTPEQLKTAGRQDAADELEALFDEEAAKAEHGHKSSKQLGSEIAEIAEELREVLLRRGLDPASRQMDVLNPAIIVVAETFTLFEEITRNEGGTSIPEKPKIDNDK